MNRLFAVLAGCALMGTAASAAPYCEALMHEDQLERRYQRLAPIYSNTETGWIFTSDQLDPDFVMRAEIETLIQEVIAEFLRRDIRLAILVPPPRAVIAGQEVVDETLGAPGIYDVTAARQSFLRFLEQMRTAGAIVPDLMQVALSEDPTAYYFRRDTHWTNRGAARSALTLAEALGHAPGFKLEDIESPETFEERGSLSDIVDATCGLRDPAEATPQFNYAALSSSGGAGLLTENEENLPDAILFGTSFSDRYRRDQYQVADALSSALGMELINSSVSGGGLIGPMEAFALSGGFDQAAPEMIIWEFPYTEVPQSSALRQLLGVLRARGSEVIAQEIVAPDEGKIVSQLPVGDQNADLLHIRFAASDIPWVKVDLIFPDGRKKTISLRRKSAMARHGQFADWWMDLGMRGATRPERLVLRIDPQFSSVDAEVSLRSFEMH